ncbi:unnamed protein product [Rhizoctonia solani]|uniref:Secreted protein n=1 Tax=Rhizoctonia solani TaxID=456999 RepID=A0A8H2XR59_9AGAM|nr:unnamed protein product [Rhizoctonia solani]
MQTLLRMLMLTLPLPPVLKRKRRNDKAASKPSPYEETVWSLGMLVDRIGIIRQTATSPLKDQTKATGIGMKSSEIGKWWFAKTC